MRKGVVSLACGVAGLALAGFLTGCATPQPVGILYTEVTLPVTATGNTAQPKEKIGISTCQSILSLVATGDASIQAAMKNGGITKIHHIDWEAKNILGIIGDYKTTVYGE